MSDFHYFRCFRRFFIFHMFTENNKGRGVLVRIFLIPPVFYGIPLIPLFPIIGNLARSEEHTSELQSLMRISYAVFCLKEKNKTQFRLLVITQHNISHIYTDYHKLHTISKIIYTIQM